MKKIKLLYIIALIAGNTYAQDDGLDKLPYHKKYGDSYIGFGVSSLIVVHQEQTFDPMPKSTSAIFNPININFSSGLRIWNNNYLTLDVSRARYENGYQTRDMHGATRTLYFKTNFGFSYIHSLKLFPKLSLLINPNIVLLKVNDGVSEPILYDYNNKQYLKYEQYKYWNFGGGIKLHLEYPVTRRMALNLFTSYERIFNKAIYTTDIFDGSQMIDENKILSYKIQPNIFTVGLGFKIFLEHKSFYKR